MELLIPACFFVALLFNVRAAFKLALDWKGMLTTVGFVREAYARLSDLPTEEALERAPAAPVFLHLVPAYQEPEIAGTVGALVASRYPHGRLHVVVVTREDEERSPHPAMGVSTGELVRRLRERLPPYQQKRLSQLAMPGSGRKAHQLNWALRPEALREILGAEALPERVFVGVSDADSMPDPDTYRWIAQHELGGAGALAYQGVTLSLANHDRLDLRGKICAVQQSSIFIRVSIARLINEVRRVRVFARLEARAPRLGRLLRPAFELFFRRSQICLGHNQFVRLDTLEALGGFPTSGATEDSTLGYALGQRGILIRAMPMVELTDLPETAEKVIRQNARWYLGVLDDIAFLRRAWRERPTPFNLAQLVRHVGNKVVEWPVAALVYPVTGWLGWYLAYTYRHQHPVLFYAAVAAPTLSLLLTIWVGGIVTQTLIEELHPYLPKRVELRRTGLREKFLGTFRCQTYWLLATRAAWRVLWALWRVGRYEAAKTDRVPAGRVPSARPTGEQARHGGSNLVRRLLAVIGLVAATAATVTPSHAAGPMQQLQQYTDRIIAILEDPKVAGPGHGLARRGAVRNATLDMFDAVEAGRRALGVHWARLTSEEQQTFVRLFVDLLERAYASKVDLYGGQRVRYLSESVDGDYALVRAKVLTKKATEVPIETKMVRRADRWLVYDVLVENIGLIANYRAQFDKIIRTSSYQELVRRLQRAREQ